jgi:hypothetical protein
MGDLNMMKNKKKIYIALVFLIIMILFGYFFWPKIYKVNYEDIVFLSINTTIEGIPHYYDLNEQEISDFVKILEKTKFYHGVSKPDRMFGDKYFKVRVTGCLFPTISIYYDTDKTYVFAKTSGKFFSNVYYRISNKNEIKNYIEKIINTKITEFKKVPSSEKVPNS